MPHRYAITTMAGVLDIEDPGGTITVERGDGDTIMSFRVRDGKGNEVTVFMDSPPALWLMSAIGACAVDL